MDEFARIRRTSETGVALIMVLWVLVMLTLFALHLLGETRLESAGVRNFKEETIGRAMAFSGMNRALAYLMADKDNAVDFVDTDGNFWTDMERDPITGTTTTEDGEVKISISDEGGKININYADPARLQIIFAHAGVPQEALNTLVDALLDWKDPDTAYRLSGAEDDYYENLPEPYKTKNAILDVPEELALVKGMDPEFLGGVDLLNSLSPVITTFGRNTLNINTVSREVMEALGMNEFEIEAVFKQRTREVGGFRFLPPQFAQAGFNSLAATIIRIEVDARPLSGDRVTKITAMVERRPYPEGYRYQTIYWRERVDTVRS